MLIFSYQFSHSCFSLFILQVRMMHFVMFVDENFLSQKVSFGICQGVVFSYDKIYCLDPSKQPRALVSLWTLVSLASQISNAKLRHCSALGFFNLASLREKPGQMALVVFQGLDNFIFFRWNHLWNCSWGWSQIHRMYWWTIAPSSCEFHEN